MKRLALVLAACAALIQPALAAHRHHHHHHHTAHHFAAHHRHRQVRHRHHYAHRHVRFTDGRPAAWCGWWMRRHLGVADRRYNLARAWAGYGSRAGAPGQGVIVVWPHHVAIIVGGSDGRGRWLMESGNDGHAVRTRYRSLRGVIALRLPYSREAARW
ncbi:MAG: hypothetical protein ACREHV_00980 [Rhizomicrobium sp.]